MSTIHTNPSKAHGFPGDDCLAVTDTPKMYTTGLEDLYNPSICNLELNEHQGEEREVVYLDDAKALFVTALAAQKEALERDIRIDELQRPLVGSVPLTTDYAHGWNDHRHEQRKANNERIQRLKETGKP
jgi:hypothetical protein